MRGALNETKLNQKLGRILRQRLPDAVIVKHQNHITPGIPDWSVTYRGFTTWIEVKYANPRIIDREVQKIFCERLSKQGRCFYVVFDSRADATYVVAPAHLNERAEQFERCAPGVSFDLVVEFIQETHVCSP